MSLGLGIRVWGFGGLGRRVSGVGAGGHNPIMERHSKMKWNLGSYGFIMSRSR